MPYRTTIAQEIYNLLDTLEHQRAFLPYWPEMLYFDFDENKAAERIEIEEYLATFPPREPSPCPK